MLKPGKSMRVRVNCGGTLFETTKETLTVEGSFFNENWDQLLNRDSMEVFLDQDPDAFRPILGYLRSKIHGLSFSLAHEEPGVLQGVASLAGHLGLAVLSDMAQDLLEGGERRRLVRELEALLAERDSNAEKTAAGLLTAIGSPQLSGLHAISVFLLYSRLIKLEPEHVTLERTAPPSSLTLSRLQAWTLVHDSPKAFAWSTEPKEPNPRYGSMTISGSVDINPPVAPTGLTALLQPSAFDVAAAGAACLRVNSYDGLPALLRFEIGDAVQCLRAALAAVEAWWETVRLGPPAWALSSPVFKPEGPLQPSQLPPPFNSIKIAKGTKFEVRYSPLFYKLANAGGLMEASGAQQPPASGTAVTPAASSSPPLVLVDEETFLDEAARMGFVRTRFALVAME